MTKHRLSTNIRKKRTTTTKLSSSTSKAKIAGGAVIVFALLIVIVAIYQVIIIDSLRVGDVRAVKIDTSTLNHETGAEEIEVINLKEDPITLSDQYSENYRLVAQRDIQRKVLPYFKKPSNYRDGFVCNVTYSSRKLEKVDCGNKVYSRFALLALERAKLTEFSTPLTTQYTVKVSF